MVRLLWDFLTDEGAATAVEYAVMLALLIVVCFVVIAAIGTTTKDLFDPEGALTGAMKSAS